LITRHDRRHSGRRTAKIYHSEKYPYEWTWWDDWTDWRDSMRSPIDRSKIRPVRGMYWYFIEHNHIIQDNAKLRRKERIRRIRRIKWKMIQGNS